jgi:flagellar hook-basal body complex protein FliE
VPVELLGTTTGTGRTALARGARAAAGAATGAPGAGFAEKLEQLVEHVEETAADANTAVSGMLDKSVDVHEAMLALTKAEQTFQLTVQIRNKLVQAYQEIMRMPV